MLKPAFLATLLCSTVVPVRKRRGEGAAHSEISSAHVPLIKEIAIPTANPGTVKFICSTNSVACAVTD